MTSLTVIKVTYTRSSFLTADVPIMTTQSKVKVTLEQAMKAQREGKNIALLIL
jgi:hypothetical protein